MAKPKVLVFSTISPLPINRGDRLRLFQALRHLRELAEVRLVFLDRNWEPAVTDLAPLDGLEVRTLRVGKPEVFRQAARTLLRRRPPVVFRFDTPRVAGFVRRQAAEFRPDVFWGSGAETGAFFPYVGSARRVLDIVDSLTLYHGTLGAQEGVPPRARLVGLMQPRLAHFERQALRDSDCTLVSSPPNRDHLQEVHGAADDIRVLYNAAPAEFLGRAWRPGGGPRMLFVGYLGYLPNAMAVRHAAREILPRVRARVPGAELVVCGGGNPRLVAELGGTPALTFTGFVDDLAAVYLSAGLLLNPVPYATGVQNKLLEALALGLPAVVSEAAGAANGVVAGRDVLVAADAEGYAEAVRAVLTDEARARALSANGRALVAERHTEAAQRRQIAEILRDVQAGQGNLSEEKQGRPPSGAPWEKGAVV